MPDFPSTLRRRREAAGYASARAFHRAFGARFFGCSYKAYLNVEAGRCVPRPRLALRIAVGLRIQDDAGAARDFVAAYLRAAVGREELAGLLVRALSARPAGPEQGSLFAKAARHSFSGRTVALTERQAELVCGSPERYWTFTALTNDRGRWSPADLGRALGFSERRAAAALRDLAASGLLEEDAAGRFHCPRAGKVYLYPRDRFFVPRHLSRLRALWDAMAERRGAVVHRRQLVVRASEAALRGCFPRLAQAVYGSHIYAVQDPGPDAAFFALSATVRRLRPFQ